MEIHTLEAQKKRTGNEPVDDRIRIFNAESEEDLESIKTKSAGRKADQAAEPYRAAAQF